MDNAKFDELWQRAEAERYAAQLSSGYGPWRQGVRRKAGIAIMLVAVVAVSLPMLINRSSATVTDDSYIMAYCNRNDINEQYWVDMADALLMDA